MLYKVLVSRIQNEYNRQTNNPIKKGAMGMKGNSQKKKHEKSTDT